jgi:hypothetical protein
MQQMAITEVEIMASVGGFSVDFGGQCCLLPDDQNIQERNHTNSISMVNWMAGLKLLRWLRKFCKCSGPHRCGGLLWYGVSLLQFPIDLNVN